MKVSELTGPLLDYWVAKAEGFETYPDPATSYREKEYRGAGVCIRGGSIVGSDYSPSSSWSQAGPILDREKIQLSPIYHKGRGSSWVAWHISFAWNQEIGGDTALIALYRCFVVSKFGEEVEDVPHA